MSAGFCPEEDRTMKKLLASTGLAAALVLPCLVAGCDRPKGPAAPKGAPTVALVMKSLANEFFKTMEDGAKAHQQKNASAYTLLANGIKDEQDVTKQINLIEQMIAQRVDALVVAPADSKAIVPVCKKALDAGIVVVNIDNRFDAAALAEKNVKIPFVGPDNRKGARLAAAHLAKRLKAGDPVAILEGLPNAFNGIQRRLGFEDALGEGGMKIVASQSGRWEMGKAEEVVASLVRERPEIKAVLCANDNMALGAVTALKAAQKLPGVTVIGFDNIKAVQELIRKGEILCTVNQHGDQIAVYGIEYALEILKTKAPPADKETPVDLVTAESLK
jgi:ribose transport system substrate-binding protein